MEERLNLRRRNRQLQLKLKTKLGDDLSHIIQSIKNKHAITYEIKSKGNYNSKMFWISSNIKAMVNIEHRFLKDIQDASFIFRTVQNTF